MDLKSFCLLIGVNIVSQLLVKHGYVATLASFCSLLFSLYAWFIWLLHFAAKQGNLIRNPFRDFKKTTCWKQGISFCILMAANVVSQLLVENGYELTVAAFFSLVFFIVGLVWLLAFVARQRKFITGAEMVTLVAMVAFIYQSGKLFCICYFNNGDVGFKDAAAFACLLAFVVCFVLRCQI